MILGGKRLVKGEREIGRKRGREAERLLQLAEALSRGRLRRDREK